MSILAAALLCALASQDNGSAELKEILKSPDRIVPYKECRTYIQLLKEGKVADFNRERGALKDKYLDFGDHLGGRRIQVDAFLDLDLGGADFSRILFGRTRFNGCALDRCDFSGSYLQEVEFYDPPSLAESVGRNLVFGNAAGSGLRPTTLNGAIFKGAILIKNKDRMWWGGFDFVDPTKIVADGMIQEWIGSEPFQRRHDRRVRELMTGISVLELSEVGRRGMPIDVKTYGVEIENPFAALDEAALKEWKEAGVDPAALKGLKALRINADARFDWVNADPKTLFVLGEGFFTMGNLYSRGPILLTGRAHVMGDVFSDSWVACVQQALPRGLVHGSKILVGEKAAGQARALLSPIAHGEFGFGKKGEDWLRKQLESQSVKTMATRLHPNPRRLISVDFMGHQTTLKELLGEAPSPFAGHPELEGLPVLILEGARMEQFDSQRVLINEDPKRIVAVPCVFRNRVETLYSEGPVLILDKDSNWSPPAIVSRSVVRAQKGKDLPRNSITFDPPAAPAAFMPDRGVQKPLPAPLAGAGIGSPDFHMVQGNGLSLVVVLSADRVTHTILAAGPLGMQLGPGFKFTMGEKHAVSEQTPEGTYVGFPDSGFKRIDVVLAGDLEREFRKYESEHKNASLAEFLRSRPLAKDPLIKKLLDSAK